MSRKGSPLLLFEIVPINCPVAANDQFFRGYFQRHAEIAEEIADPFSNSPRDPAPRFGPAA